ncbi:MAG: hypothetical protein EXR50_00235 [Dehalococcoidia bacterium]|nr:hypothetical protein [Dehalococcoidia bacterium]
MKIISRDRMDNYAKDVVTGAEAGLIRSRVLEEIDQSPTTIERVSVTDEARAREIIRQYDDKNSSLTDATNTYYL